MTTLPLTYYAQFRDAAGTLVAGTDGQTWFAVGDVSADVVSTNDFGSSGNSPTFNPLRFLLGTDTIDPALLAAEAAGTRFSQIEIAGYSGTGSSAMLVTDDVFKGAAIQTLTSLDTGVYATVDYADTVQRRTLTDANGNALPPTVAGYNRLTKQPDTSTNTAGGGAGHAPDAPVSGTPPVTDTSAQLAFYVQFRDTAGNALSTSAGQTWFAVSDLSVASAQTASIVGTGAAPAAIVFDPLSFTIDGTALPALFAAQATGMALGDVEVAGYLGTGAGATLAEDFLDRNARVATLGTLPDGSQTVTLETTDLVQSVYPPAMSGGGGLGLPIPVTAGWNHTTNTPDTTTDTQAPLVGTPAAAPAAPLTYYVQFRNGSGTLLTGNGGQSWFAAADVGYGSAEAFNAASAATGFSFAPLTFTLAPDSVLVGLFATQASGRLLQQIELAGYDANGVLVTDNAFKAALATDDSVITTGADSLEFAYDAFTQTTHGKNVLGLPQQSTQGYDLRTNMADTTASLAAPTGAVPPTSPGAGPLGYYVQIRLMSGALLTGTGGRTWFAVGDVGFDTTQTLTGTSAGKTGFGALSFTLNADKALPALFQQEAAGTPFQSVELAGYSGSGAAATLVTDDLFKLAPIASDTVQPDGTNTLSFQYGGLLKTAYAPDVNGTPVAVASQGWNNIARRSDDTTAPIGGGTTYALAAPVTGTPATAANPGPLAYFVQFRNYDGTYVADASNATWFAVTGLTLPTSQPAASQSSGAGAAKVVFDPASFTFDDPLLQPKLFGASAAGTVYASVEIAGYAGDNSNAPLVQDDVLKLVVVSAVQSGSSDSTTVAVNYGGLVERSYTPNASGMATLAGTGGWNRLTNAQDTGTASLATANSAGTAQGAIPVAPLTGTPDGLSAYGYGARLDYYIEVFPTASRTPFMDTAGETFIPVTGVSFTTRQPLDVASQTTGTGTGRVEFDPLTFTIAPNSLSATLLTDLTVGTALNSLFLLGYKTNGVNNSVQSFSDQFRQVLVDGLTTNGDGSETVSIRYGALEERATAPAPSGGVITTPPAGWNRIRNTSDTTGDTSGAPYDRLPNSSPACYCPGTRIATPGGEVTVEDLAEGDLVLTADGRVQPVVWIGRRSYGGRFVAGRRDILPVTIAAGALADGIPARDLTISPEHAMLIDGLLIPARVLVNGTTITQATRIEAVDYLHVELAQHEAILAEGAPSESFVDDDSRGAFHNASEWQGRYRAGPALYCAPRAESGYELEAIRTRIARRERSRAA